MNGVECVTRIACVSFSFAQTYTMSDIIYTVVPVCIKLPWHDRICLWPSEHDQSYDNDTSEIYFVASRYGFLNRHAMTMDHQNIRFPEGRDVDLYQKIGL